MACAPPALEINQLLLLATRWGRVASFMGGVLGLLVQTSSRLFLVFSLSWLQSEVTRDSYEGEQAFNRLSMEERSKFKEETLVNVGDIRKRAESRLSGEAPGQSEYIVVRHLHSPSLCLLLGQ